MNELILLPRKKTENNREYACRVLRYNIMVLNLAPGETLNENEICQYLKVSRTPVHEALTLLKSEQLVNIVPQSGSNVSLINLNNIREGLFFRSTIEPQIYHQLAGNISLKYLDAMNQNLTEAEQILANSPSNELQIHELIQLDDHFHKLAYEAANKLNIWSAMKSVCSHMDRIRYQGHVTQLDDYQKNHDDHKLIYEYLLINGNPSFDFANFYTNHLTQFQHYFPTLYKEHPEHYAMD